MSIYKRGNVYWYKFMWNGEVIRESTKQGNDKKARSAESQHRARLAQQQKDSEAARNRLGCAEVLPCHECERLFNAAKAVRKEDNVFCTPKCANAWRKSRTMPTLKGFLEDRFVPDAETRHKAKPMTVRYYRQGADMLKRSRLAELRLDELTDEHAQQFAAEYSRLSPSGINRGLRTLRRALNLGYKWNQLDKPIKVELAKGENQRERVLTDAELTTYLDACPQPWRDAASIISEEGMRPSEVFALRWPHVFIGEDGTGLIRVVEGKSKAARRILPMTPVVYALIKARYEAQECPADGWIFPKASGEAHLTGDNVKEQHSRALKESGVEAFVPYVLRHTGLTRLAKATNGDVFALARIAGHSSITITQRYVHPQADTIEGIFARAVLSQSSRQEKSEQDGKNAEVGTKLGTARESIKRLSPPTRSK
jgi:integrase